MTPVIIESPYAGDTEINIAYALRCMRDSLSRGESPYASHITWAASGALDDSDQVEREKGMAAGFAWMRRADKVCVYTDLGISHGMNEGIKAADQMGIPVEYRKFGE